MNGCIYRNKKKKIEVCRKKVKSKKNKEKKKIRKGRNV